MKSQLSFELGFLFGRLLPWIVLVALTIAMVECAAAVLL